MKLRDWLNLHGMRSEFFAKKLGVTGSCISNWMRGKNTPKAHFMLLIEKETKGKVTLKDWVKNENV
jgi:transcriptional regulator with XRE-family HTH domain